MINSNDITPVDTIQSATDFNGAKPLTEKQTECKCDSMPFEKLDRLTECGMKTPLEMMDDAINNVRRLIEKSVSASPLTEHHTIDGSVSPAILPEQIVPVTPQTAPIISCGVDVLDNILTKIEPIDWSQYKTTGSNGETKPPSEKVYLLRTVDQILYTAKREGTPIVNHVDRIYHYATTHYDPVNEMALQNFLIEAAVRCGVRPYTAMYQTFVEKLIKQFMINSARRNSNIAVPDTSYINLRNGTLFFSKKGHRFETHSHQRFIRYRLHFDYDPKATAPLWQKHLDRALPNPDKQEYLAKCLALPFYCDGRIEKAPLLLGQRDTGKSTTLLVLQELLGMENITTESLAALTKSDTQGDYARARLDGKLLNIASDISAKINDEGITKVIISRERVSARHPYGEGFDMRNYARLIFAMNDLPHQFFTDAALTKRAAIILFDQQINADEIDTGFVEKIIANELPGVLNWILTVGLVPLLKIGRLDPPQCCLEDMARIRKDVDPLSAWLAEKDYQPGNAHWIVVKEAHDDFDKFCRRNRNVTPATKTFTKRLRELGYTTDCINHSIGVRLYYSHTIPENQSGQAAHPAPEPLDPDHEDYFERSLNGEVPF